MVIDDPKEQRTQFKHVSAATIVLVITVSAWTTPLNVDIGAVTWTMLAFTDTRPLARTFTSAPLATSRTTPRRPDSRSRAPTRSAASPPTCASTVPPTCGRCPRRLV